MCDFAVDALGIKVSCILIRCGDEALIAKCKCCSRDTEDILREPEAQGSSSNVVTEDIRAGQR